MNPLNRSDLLAPIHTENQSKIEEYAHDLSSHICQLDPEAAKNLIPGMYDGIGVRPEYSYP